MLIVPRIVVAAIVPQRLVDIIQGNNLFAKCFGTSLPGQECSADQQILLIQEQPAQLLSIAVWCLGQFFTALSRRDATYSSNFLGSFMTSSIFRIVSSSDSGNEVRDFILLSPI